MDYVYELLHRDEWREIGPAPPSHQQDPAAAAAFKKNSRKQSKP